MQQGAGAKPYRARLRVDQSFFLELQFCNEHGIAHSEFLSWSTSDRAKALAFILEKATRCVMCGTGDFEWDPAQGGSRFAYEPVQRYCHGCYLKGVSGQDVAANPGISVELAPTGTVESARRYVANKRAYEQRSPAAAQR